MPARCCLSLRNAPSTRDTDLGAFSELAYNRPIYSGFKSYVEFTAAGADGIDAGAPEGRPLELLVLAIIFPKLEVHVQAVHGQRRRLLLLIDI